MNFEVVMEMQRICTGESRELTRGQLAAEVIDLKEITKGFKPERIQRCKEYYEQMISDDTKKVYDVDTLMEETEAIKKEFDDYILSNNADDKFLVMYNKIEDLLINSPFEGLDGTPYGIAEVSIFSLMEYFAWKKLGSDHEWCRSEYRDSLVHNTEGGEPVAEHWMKFYDNLQSKYATLGDDFGTEEGLKLLVTAGSIIALAAMRDQDEYMLDMAQAGALPKAKEIVESMNHNEYSEGDSTFVDNTVALFRFVYNFIVE